MKCSNCGTTEFRPIIAKATWNDKGIVRRRALGVWSCKGCGYGEGKAFHSDTTAKIAFVTNQIMRFVRSRQSWSTSYRLMRGAWWREDRPA